jgi:hypothetical protein
MFTYRLPTAGAVPATFTVDSLFPFAFDLEAARKAWRAVRAFANDPYVDKAAAKRALAAGRALTLQSGRIDTPLAETFLNVWRALPAAEQTEARWFALLAEAHDDAVEAYRTFTAALTRTRSLDEIAYDRLMARIEAESQECDRLQAARVSMAIEAELEHDALAVA